MSVAVSIDEGADASENRGWAAGAMALLECERLKAGETPLFQLPLPEFDDIRVFIKDETTHPSGSLKHRLARALFAHAICNGDIVSGTTVVEASSGSAAISEAWFAKALGLPFVAVVPASTATAKVAEIRWSGGDVIRTAADEDCALAAFRIAAERRGHFMNQFARASEVIDWRGANTLPETLFSQVEQRTGRAPDWVVAGAGTGGTSASIGRYMRYRPHLARTRLCVVDPEHSAYFKAYVSGDWSIRGEASMVVEGIGRPRVEASFNPSVVDKMIAIPDAASVAAAHWLEERAGRRFGPSTGTNIVGALLLAHSMRDRGQSGTIATLACDGGDRYADTVFSHAWLASRGLDIAPWRDLPRKIGAFALPHSDDRDF
ncbi:PLP-dependent cysteine synthase family protein [Sphingomonas colocasiae]|uniref:PLP-dependent cysteine synthase family protein n=1 Tax=Sphingomonas colocasiae TaxID=1848973 RepID=A0ABS7PSS7_9SPHN|nr:PLP-dependent cysteine synthase family protein [Sphingomonas colocasiae]MBY8823442.1 PLP-dependent cysteine synthase family protein [Sphingomonas colocasiae]